MQLALLVVAATLWPTAAFAYVGPGLGAGTIGILLGLLASVLLAILAVFWYPIKRMTKRFRNKSAEAAQQRSEPDRERAE